ncbi:ABC transporter ATP-binding protein [Aceticella autotrophica]|uniref:ABC transporter ATP-binding protein n=1 Tax=Aceticella autotrophica TaxID=2755338 RepID=A0A975AVI4_9THEO|nr:ABC transporter ATP-binding protein [Aceticella autotrophica]QSZ27198.1 ABC transporter ATP-binding protein [Aceticella autotrophica]
MIIEVKNLTKSYEGKKAVDDVSFNIEEGEIFGIIGPNGAGKTTILECIEGLRIPDSGYIRVLNFNPLKDRKKMYEYIGVQLQETTYPDRLKVWEICRLFSSFYNNPVPYNDLLRQFDLEEKKNSYISKLSGGQKQKLSIILALIPNPKIVFLDELTTGLDPQARRSMWGYIKELKEKGLTICLTTHYMEEAEYLCDRVAIINEGKIAAIDTVDKLINLIDSGVKIIFTCEEIDIKKLENLIFIKKVEKYNNEIHVYCENKDNLTDLINFLQNEGIKFSNLKTINPGLEDVFLKITGYKIEK